MSLKVNSTTLSGSDQNLSDSTPNPSAGEINVNFNTTNSSGTDHVSANVVLAEVNHSLIGSLGWPNSAHTSGTGNEGVAAFDNAGDPETLSFSDLAGQLSHADLQDLGWEATGITAASPDRVAGWDSLGDRTLYGPSELATFLQNPIQTQIETSIDDALITGGSPGSIEAAMIAHISASITNGQIRDYVLSALTRPKYPQFEAVEYMEIVQASVSSQALIADQALFMMHYQEEESCEYTKMTITTHSTIAAGGTKNLQFGLYVDLDDDGYPETCIWHSSVISLSAGLPSNSTIETTFSAGTWTANAGDFEAANGNLFCKRGSTVWRARVHDFNLSTKCINASAVRSIGRNANGADKAWAGLEIIGTTITGTGGLDTDISANPGTTGGFGPIHTQIPILPLTRA